MEVTLRSRASEDQHGDSLLLPLHVSLPSGGDISVYLWLDKRDGKITVQS